MPLHEPELQQAVTQVWSTILGMEAQPSDPSQELSRDAWLGSVKIHGTRELTVSLSCPERTARLATAAMFDVNAEAATLEQLRDTWGELANMVAGTFKSLLSGDCFLGLPAVSEIDGDEPASGHRILIEAGFQCEDDCLRVTIIDRRSTIRRPPSELT